MSRTSDLPQRLRAEASGWSDGWETRPNGADFKALLREAAAEIESLEARLFSAIEECAMVAQRARGNVRSDSAFSEDRANAEAAMALQIMDGIRALAPVQDNRSAVPPTAKFSAGRPDKDGMSY